MEYLLSVSMHMYRVISLFSTYNLNSLDYARKLTFATKYP